MDRPGDPEAAIRRRLVPDDFLHAQPCIVMPGAGIDGNRCCPLCDAENSAMRRRSRKLALGWCDLSHSCSAHFWPAGLNPRGSMRCNCRSSRKLQQSDEQIGGMKGMKPRSLPSRLVGRWKSCGSPKLLDPSHHRRLLDSGGRVQGHQLRKRRWANTGWAHATAIQRCPTQPLKKVINDIYCLFPIVTCGVNFNVRERNQGSSQNGV